VSSLVNGSMSSKGVKQVAIDWLDEHRRESSREDRVGATQPNRGMVHLFPVDSKSLVVSVIMHNLFRGLVLVRSSVLVQTLSPQGCERTSHKCRSSQQRRSRRLNGAYDGGVGRGLTGTENASESEDYNGREAVRKTSDEAIKMCVKAIPIALGALRKQIEAKTGQ
jgi:hypothetical protein